MAGLLDFINTNSQPGYGEAGLLGNMPWFQHHMWPGGRMMPRNFDQMIVPPYTLPPDRNALHPDEMMRLYFGPGSQERI